MSAERLDEHTLAAARVWATHTFPYLASALFAMKVVSAPGIGATAVDEGWRLYVDPATADGWTAQEMGALLVHHVGHLVREHADRARSLGIDRARSEQWTKACDAELNDDLADAGITPPGDVVLPETLGGDRGRLAEEYFHLTQKPKDGDGQGDGENSDGDDDADDELADGPGRHDHGSGTDGLPRDWDRTGAETPPLSKHEADLVRRKVADDIEAAARQRSDVPGGWKRWAEDLLHPTVDWRRALAAEIRAAVNRYAGRVDYSYRRPSRRAGVSPGVVLPSMEAPVPEVAVVVDTSASMGQPELARVLAEIDGLLKAIGMRSQGVKVLAVDTEVHASARVSSSRQVALAGGGGTDMSRGIEAAAALRPRPSVIVVLTDGYTPWPAERPKASSVVVGLLDAPSSRWPVPEWARTVRIDPAS